MPLTETNSDVSQAIVIDNHKRAAEEILSSYHAAQELAKGTQDFAQQAIDEARRCGAMLNAKKEELGHGHWMDWLATYLPELKKSIGTIERYMRLSNSSHVINLEKGKPKSLRQAYIAAGILPDPVVGQRKRIEAQTKPLKATNGSSNHITLLHQLFAEKAIEALVQTQPDGFARWSEVELEMLVKLLEPLTIARHRMIYALKLKLEAKHNGDD